MSRQNSKTPCKALLPILLGSLSFLFISTAGFQTAAGEKPWTGKLKDGTTITAHELRKIIKEKKYHTFNSFLSQEKEKKQLVNFTSADLSRVDLSGADLSGLALLERADLSSANLSSANLSGALLKIANLSRANLFAADLSGADLSGTNLSRANLHGADLTGADLMYANLSGARLDWEHISNVSHLEGAILDEVLCEPEPTKMPNVHVMAPARGLWLMIYKDNPSGLERLRKAFEAEGYYRQEREILHAIKHNREGVGWDSYLTLLLTRIAYRLGHYALTSIVFVDFVCFVVRDFLSLCIMAPEAEKRHIPAMAATRAKKAIMPTGIGLIGQCFLF